MFAHAVLRKRYAFPLQLLELKWPRLMPHVRWALTVHAVRVIMTFRGWSEVSPCVPYTVGSRHLIHLMEHV